MDRFARLRNKKSLVCYLTLGYPTRQKFFELVETLRRCDIDVLEVGLPTINPYMDGPIVGESHAVALANGWSIEHLQADLDLTRRILEDLPILLEGYRETILHSNAPHLKSIDGIVCLDGQEMEFPEPLVSIQICDEYMTDETLAEKAGRSRGFIYVLSARGKSEVRPDIPSAYAGTIERLNKFSNLPKFVGFGINSSDEARQVGKNGADGIIIGSGIIRRLHNEQELKRYLIAIRAVLK